MNDKTINIKIERSLRVLKIDEFSTWSAINTAKTTIHKFNHPYLYTTMDLEE